jgi:hypothetical protein
MMRCRLAPLRIVAAERLAIESVQNVREKADG